MLQKTAVFTFFPEKRTTAGKIALKFWRVLKYNSTRVNSDYSQFVLKL
jgi:hypothetical protein